MREDQRLYLDCQISHSDHNLTLKAPFTLWRKLLRTCGEMLRSLFYRKLGLRGTRDQPTFSRENQAIPASGSPTASFLWTPRAYHLSPQNSTHHIQDCVPANDTLWSKRRLCHDAQWVFIKLAAWRGCDMMKGGVGC